MEWIIAHRTPELTALYKFFTSLGDAGFFVLFVPIGYWLWRPETFTRFGLLLLGSAMLNVSLKELFEVPRPNLSQLIQVTGWSFPSGHAQIAASVWPWLALELGHRRNARTRLWLWLAAIVLVIGVATSRVYLGVHTPLDVVVGVAIGAALAAFAWRLTCQPLEWWQRLGKRRQALAISLVITGWILLVVPTSTDSAAAAGSGTLLGFWIAIFIKGERLDLLPATDWRPFVALCIGVLGLGILRLGLKELFVVTGPASPFSDLIRYLAIGVWIGLAPLLFSALGWARPQLLADASASES